MIHQLLRPKGIGGFGNGGPTGGILLKGHGQQIHGLWSKERHNGLTQSCPTTIITLKIYAYIMLTIFMFFNEFNSTSVFNTLYKF